MSMYKKTSNLGCLTQNLRTRANLSTKAKRLVPEGGLCSEVPLYYIVGCKHRASEGVFHIGGCDCVLCQFIESVTFARCAFIFALRNIALSGYLDTHRNI